jgi:threonyl-tRNA synthetase
MHSSTPEQYLEYYRHTLAHLLAAAVMRLYPTAQRTIGPAVDDGFYFDFDFGATPVTEADLPKIEKEMRKLLPTWTSTLHRDVTEAEAKALYPGNIYKHELIDEIAARGEALSIYTNSQYYEDLCRGGHLENPATEIDPLSFTLVRTAGAYWRGDEKNKMLTRIYGFAFLTAAELAVHTEQLEEAKKRDHRKLGTEQELFMFSPIVGQGLPLWLPKGATIRRELERFITDTEIAWGYLHVYTPDIAKLDLYKKSGHYPYYKESMYAPINIDGDEFMLRPMTCPHHFELFSHTPKSYRDLPMRIAELAKLYRYEASGELSGLVRVRSFCLADAHIITAGQAQAKSEVARALDLIQHVATVFGLVENVDYHYRLSLGDRTDAEKYYKNDSAWDAGEQILREVLNERGAQYVEAPQEAAFYGPKIDIQMKDVRGKDNTAFTVQYDFCMPDRFELEYTAEDGTKKRPIVIHRSSIGAIERVMAFLIERYAGAFPLWLSPVQVAVLPVAGAHSEHAEKVLSALMHKGIRAELRSADDSLGKRIRTTKMEKVPYVLVLGDAEVADGTVTVEHRSLGKLGEMHTDILIEKLQEEIRTRAIV